VAFLLALLGFGAKAGLVPLHVWLPEAHPAAPSPVSALMSGVMLKTAVYGFLRVAYDLLPVQLWWWGVLVLALGLASAVLGVVFAAVQTDMKRLLAWSSIENIGLIFAGIGLALLFAAYRMPAVAALALTAALYHVASHAFFKALLFLATGAVLHATSERSLGRLGGLLRVMPWVGWACLLGVLASAGLPPLGGFVSEWLLLQSFLFTPGLPNAFLNMLVPAVAAVIALVAALAGYTMVKFYGVIFLGQHREDKLAAAHDAGSWERLGMVWLMAGCVALGLFPVQGIEMLAPVTELLVGARLPDSGSSWLLVPVAAERASYGPLIFFAGVAASFGLAYVLVRRLYHGRLRRAAPWDCGFPWQTARMQDTAEGFGQPVRQIFEPLFRMRRDLPTAFDARPRYAVEVGDHFWHWLYLPLARLVESAARVIGTLQRGRIAIYLLYSFATVIAVLIWVTR
jgi:formate hydrogenlyase subunit 3/multisubunit Na+/H+ antiporter MnhD subunit